MKGGQRDMDYRVVADENVAITPSLNAICRSLVRIPGRAITTDHLKDADILLVRSVTRVDQRLLMNTPISFVGTATAGLDHIDLNYLSANEIGFAAAPGANANAVAEYVISVLAARGRLPHILAGGGLGLVGYGHVGCRLAEVVSALGGAVYVWDPLQSVPDCYKSPSLEHVLKQPVVSVHAALHATQPWPSRGLIDEDEVTACSGDCLFINASRGEIVTEAALANLGRMGAEIVLDVWPDEPAISELQLNRVVLGTPHIAGYSLEAKRCATNMLTTAITGEKMVQSASLPDTIDVRATETQSVDDWLRALILGHYDPMVDYRQLCSIATDSISGDAFEGLRRSYRLRGELRGRHVRVGERLPESALSACLALGVTPVAGHGIESE